ncbi:MAG: hypothetical protein AAFX81_14240 [Pseudomonadota bacterium]
MGTSHWGAAVAAIWLSMAMPAGLSAQEEPPAGPGAIGLELNKLEQVDASCRAYIVIRNDSGADLESLDVDLVTFQSQGVIGSRYRVELAPVAAEKTLVKTFDLADVECAQIERVLLNDVVTCPPFEAAACLAALELSTLSVEFFR